MTSPRGRIPPRIFENLRAAGVNYALPFVSWAITEPIEDSYDWNSVDYLYRPYEISRLGYTLNGHCMIFFLDEPWNLPSYVRSMSFEKLKQAISTHVFTLVTHYKGVIAYWTINEPTFSYSDFFKLSQAQWIEIVNTAAQGVRKADPKAKIMVNVVPADHPEIGYSPHGILDALLSQEVEFDVIGIELYPRPEFGIVPDENGYPSIEWASDMLDSFARFGKSIILSEVAVTNVPSEKAQAEWLRAFYAMAFEKPFVKGITWYFVDDDPFVPGAGLFLNYDSPPRPVYQALADVILERTSQGTAKADSKGQVRIEGYAGDYLIEVSDGTRTSSFSIHIPEGKEVPNLPPIAKAGPDQVVATGAKITLDGSSSSDPDGDSLSYSWALASKPTGSNVDLADKSSPSISFTADKDGLYKFQLIVRDGHTQSSPDYVMIRALGREGKIIVATNKNQYEPGNTLGLYIWAGNISSAREVKADAFIGFGSPDGSLYFLESALNLKPSDPTDPRTFSPFALNAIFPSGWVFPNPQEMNADSDDNGKPDSYRLFSVTLPPYLTPGTYFAFAVLAEPGSVQAGSPRIVGDISIVSFSYSP